MRTVDYLFARCDSALEQVKDIALGACMKVTSRLVDEQQTTCAGGLMRCCQAEIEREKLQKPFAALLGVLIYFLVAHVKRKFELV